MMRLCTLCARAGSKGVTNKNIRSLCGMPLLAHSILQAQGSGLFDHIAVSSDSEDILDIAAAYGVKQLVMRPAELSGDEAPKIPAIRHCAAEIESRLGCSFDTVADLDVTAPLRTIEDIAGAVLLLENSVARNVVSGHPSRRSPYFNMVEQNGDGSVRLVKPVDPPLIRRQDTPLTYDLNASVYVWERDWLFTCERLFHTSTRIYIMPAQRSMDIDSELDFQMVDFLLQKRKECT
ncbi:acylneuraminate cytidylyltransferase family protein [Paenibacillus sp. y28]|uniref:acylneuraminate cytidylyltransferase family protein n=1 Tax=Paenibacillus sp. y28 TaxID=3129110 RepID=UPI003018386E